MPATVLPSARQMWTAIVIVILAEVADVVTTAAALERCCREANPASSMIISWGGIAGFGLIKIVLAAAVLVLVGGLLARSARGMRALTVAMRICALMLTVTALVNAFQLLAPVHVQWLIAKYLTLLIWDVRSIL